MQLAQSTKLNSKGITQFVLFNAGGLSFLIVGYLVFVVLYGVFHWAWLPAKIVGDALGWTSNFVIQYFLAFGDTHKSRQPKVVFGKFTSISLLNLLLDYAIVAGLKQLGVSPFIGLLVASQFFTIWKWYWYKHWVFSDNKILRQANAAKRKK